MINNIEHPKHYNSLGAKCACGQDIECIQVVENMNFNIGNAIKYLWRSEHKNGLEDLKKAAWYVQREIQRLDTETKDA